MKKCTKEKIVTKDFIREEIARVIVRKGGLPKFCLKYIIMDMESLGLISKLNKTNLYILNSDFTEKKVNNLISFGM